MKPLWRQVRDRLEMLSSEGPVALAFIVFVGVSFLVISITYEFGLYDAEFFANILVEAHGMLFDLLIIGCFVLWLNRLGEKRQTVKRYQEEIEDYLGWESDEATYRIVGNIKRLNRENVFPIDLYTAYLQKANLQKANLQWANLYTANLYTANLHGANLQGADLYMANLHGAILSEANLQGTQLQQAQLQGANLSEANLSEAILQGAILQGAILQGAILQGAILQGADLSGAQLQGADLSGTRLDYVQHNQNTIWPDGFTPPKQLQKSKH